MFQQICRALSGTDNRVLMFFHKACRCDLLDASLSHLTELGSTIFLFVVASAMLPFKKRKARQYGILLLAGITLARFSSRLFKELFMRARPYVSLGGATAMVGAGGYSFPSGHATAAFMGAYILSKCFGRSLVFFSLAVLVAFSRVYLGVHYPTDVLAGAALGTFIGYLVVRLSGMEER